MELEEGKEQLKHKMRAGRRDPLTPVGSYLRPSRSLKISTNALVPLGANAIISPPDLVAMDWYTPDTSFYPCHMRAVDVLAPHPTPPPIYYLTDYTYVVHNDSGWPTATETDVEADKEEGENTSNRGSSVGNTRTVAHVQPLGLLSVRAREYDEKQKFSGGIPIKMAIHQRRGGYILRVCPVLLFLAFTYLHS